MTSDKTLQDYTNKYGVGIGRDEYTKQTNIDKGNPLCRRCGGTGNELYSMYRQCEHCKGTGVKDDPQDT